MLDTDAARRALDGVETAYYLVHSLGAREFEERDRRAASTFARVAREAGIAEATTDDTPRGNTEGTPVRALTGTRGHASSGDSFFLRGFCARGFPALPAVPVSLLDGKEGVSGSSPEGA